MSATAVIVDVVRTPSGRGKPGGALAGEHPVDLAAVVLRAHEGALALETVALP